MPQTIKSGDVGWAVRAKNLRRRRWCGRDG